MTEGTGSATEATDLRKVRLPPPTIVVQSWPIVCRFSLAGGTLGLAVGLFEATLLYSTPRVPALLEPDVSFAIWFLAPLIDLTFFALIGSVLGWGAALGKVPAPRRSLILAISLIGIAGAHVTWSLELVHRQMGDFRLGATLTTPAIGFAVSVVAALLLARIWWRQAVRFLSSLPAAPHCLWMKVLVASGGFLAAGLGFCWFWPLTSAAPAQAGEHAPTNSPNIVLITLDTVRADHLSAYGYDQPTTPNLERLACRGVLFENAVAPSSWTLPSHASIFTGLLPHQHGANTIIPLSETPRTLAEVMQSHGYETAGFSSNLYYGLAGWGINQGFSVYDDDGSLLRHNLASTLLGRVLHDPIYFNFIRPDFYFRRNAKELNGEILYWARHRPARPFFLFINYFDAHYPYQAPSPYTARFGPSPDVQIRQPNTLEYGYPPRPLSAGEQAALITGYDNCLAYLDAQVGDLVASFASQPELENTIWIITSDHGESFGEHGTYDHGWDLYREVLHVPLIMFGPGIPEDRRLEPVVRVREIFPTVLDLAFSERPPFRRTSLRRFWTPTFHPESFDEVVVSEVRPSFPVPNVPVSISLMTSEWHYIHYATGREILFHLKTDTREKVDLSRSEEHQQTLWALRERLREVVEFSVRPWHGTEYLVALDRPGQPFLLDLAFNRDTRPVNSLPQLRVGISQAALPPDTPSGSGRPLPADRDLIESLPYH